MARPLRSNASWVCEKARLLLDDAHDVALLHDQEIFAIDLHFRAAPFAEQHLVALFDVERHELARLVARAGSDGEHLALLGFLGGGVGDDDTAGSFGLAVYALDDDAIMQGAELHGFFELRIGLVARHARGRT